LKKQHNWCLLPIDYCLLPLHATPTPTPTPYTYVSTGHCQSLEIVQIIRKSPEQNNRIKVISNYQNHTLCGLRMHKVRLPFPSDSSISPCKRSSRSRRADLQFSIFPFHSTILEIGVGLTSFGGFFMFLGVMLFFDGGLLALGNVSLASQRCFHCIWLITISFLHSSYRIIVLSTMTTTTRMTRSN
jgi:hypothetical protein